MRALVLAAALVLVPGVAVAAPAEGEVALASVGSGKCVQREVSGAVHGATCGAVVEQSWHLTQTSDLRLAITAAGADLCLAYDEVEVVSTPCDELETMQAWRLVAQDGSYWIQSAKDDGDLTWCLWQADGSDYVGLQPCDGSVVGERWRLPQAVTPQG
ncbi:ricin-type beta-trefoil lectin domain protein [Actinokineospora inagensis]|uniref:ricin-type beta-trefoil lectin domain protein n=1 Tax=Actinokineospora inagensis TaxID=103730 RepID=UPI000410FB59|nr:ricin-type beta-trefoil lectin domain protein [Actinokineospora inagensis]